MPNTNDLYMLKKQNEYDMRCISSANAMASQTITNAIKDIERQMRDGEEIDIQDLKEMLQALPLGLEDIADIEYCENDNELIFYSSDGESRYGSIPSEHMAYIMDEALRCSLINGDIVTDYGDYQSNKVTADIYAVTSKEMPSGNTEYFISFTDFASREINLNAYGLVKVDPQRQYTPETERYGTFDSMDNLVGLVQDRVIPALQYMESLALGYDCEMVDVYHDDARMLKKDYSERGDWVKDFTKVLNDIDRFESRWKDWSQVWERVFESFGIAERDIKELGKTSENEQFDSLKNEITENMKYIKEAVRGFDPEMSETADEILKTVNSADFNSDNITNEERASLLRKVGFIKHDWKDNELEWFYTEHERILGEPKLELQRILLQEELETGNYEKDINEGWKELSGLNRMIDEKEKEEMDNDNKVPEQGPEQAEEER